MKKLIALISVFLLLFSLMGMAACSGGKDADPAAEYLGGKESFSLTADKETAAPGETVTVTFHAENCKNVACFDVVLKTPDNVTLTGCKEKESGDFITSALESGEDVVFSAIIATTGNIDSMDMMTATFTVSEDAVPGDAVTFKAEFSSYLVGTDESGDETADATSLVAVVPVTVTVS
ncbi:MAG: hypothetical protein IJK89_08075 [Clostridia bacterium]|nr:hypothetical protein [Clostridia bacterium]